MGATLSTWHATAGQTLHDIVAHHLAVMVIQAGAGRMAAPEVDAMAGRFASIRDSGDRALSELEHLVGLLQPDAGDRQPDQRNLVALLDQAQAPGGEDLAIELSDRGGAAAAPVAGTGAKLGLIGMRERIELLGGRLETGPDRTGGWIVCARLPMNRRRVSTPAG